SGTLITQREVLRREVVKSADQNDQVARYTGMLSSDDIQSRWRIPSQLSPPLPFDSIILVFVFIFPLYFISQFCMMSVMNERLERRGETLLSTPLAPSAIIAGKILPYFAGMGLIAIGLTLWLGAPLVIVLPLLPVMLFFLANALLIGMVARSFKELSFISIFFSTLATSYLFFPTIFANVHVVSLISPLTLVVLALQGAGFSAADYFYSTALFYLTGAVLFYIAVANFREERLFTQSPFFTRIREFIEEGLSRKRPLTSLFAMNMLLIPFVFMVQMMFLVLFFNIPMPLSLILLIGLAALAEEVVKSLGIYTLFSASRSFASWRFLIPASAVTALGFLAGEKLFLFAMLSQITDSVFGSILFLSLQVLWMPFLIHFTGVLIVGISLRYLGKQGYVPALLLATVVHALYNIIIITGAHL
ncbi:MAG: PrsW family intramembrane metalloprotease, partial [Methanomicrobiales archaeon]|nr:PrsW family intramembrane metalloprotease [Methanomicrobiales archaeon]